MAVNMDGTSAAPAEYRLPCGRELNELWEHVADGGLDGHERDCPHCHSAAASVRALQGALAEMRSEAIEPPAGLTEKIMAVVRAEGGRGAMVPLPSPHGPVTVSRAAVAVVLRYAADTVPGVRARDCAIRPVGADAEGHTVVRVRLGLAIAYGTGPAQSTLDRVRRQVTAAAAAQVGLRVAAVDLRVDDVYPPTQAAGVRFSGRPRRGVR